MPFKGLPDAANKLWEKVYNASIKAGDKKEVAAKKAWSAVSGAYKKVGDKWVKKSDIESEFSMSIVKSAYTKKDNTMRVRMVASDDGKDWHGERMSIGLFQRFIERIKGNLVPEWLAPHLDEKSGWSGGMPYLSVSHYNSGQEGKNIVGNIEKLYIDGNRLKAVAVLKDNDLGRAVFRAINEDLEGVSKYEDKIRVSIKFADLAHTHDDKEYSRDGLESKCEMCENYPVDVYKDGLLIHLAFTRKPANPRSSVEVDKMADEIMTRKDDAVSIVGDELAEELEVNKSVLPEEIIVIKDEGMVEPAKEETAPVPDEKAVQETSEPEVVEPAVVSASDVVSPNVESATPAQPSVLESVFAELSKKIDESRKRCKTKSEFVSEVQPWLNALAGEIEKMYQEPESEEEDKKEDKEEDETMKSILNAIRDLTGKVDAVMGDVATLKSNVPAAPVAQVESTPRPRQITLKAKTVMQPANKLPSIDELALRSVMNK